MKKLSARKIIERELAKEWGIEDPSLLTLEGEERSRLQEYLLENGIIPKKIKVEEMATRLSMEYPNSVYTHLYTSIHKFVARNSHVLEKTRPGVFTIRKELYTKKEIHFKIQETVEYSEYKVILDELGNKLEDMIKLYGGEVIGNKVFIDDNGYRRDEIVLSQQLEHYNSMKAVIRGAERGTF